MTQPPEPLLLASTSPQRRAILTQLGIPFEAVAPEYEERDPPGIEPAAAARMHALGKARSVAGRKRAGPVLGVDTVVALGGRSFGKPAGERDAARMLRELAGRTHEVVSGLCLLGPGFEIVEHDVTLVTFRLLSERDVETYVAAGEWRDRAGGYAIQGKGAALVERIDGDYQNVVGLPVSLLVRVLSRELPGVYGFGG